MHFFNKNKQSISMCLKFFFKREYPMRFQDCCFYCWEITGNTKFSVIYRLKFLSRMRRRSHHRLRLFLQLPASGPSQPSPLQQPPLPRAIIQLLLLQPRAGCHHSLTSCRTRATQMEGLSQGYTDFWVLHSRCPSPAFPTFLIFI